MTDNINSVIIKEFESLNIKLDSSDVVFLNKFHRNHLKIKQISNDEFEIKASSYIGLIELPSKIRITINPKIKITNLLYLISFTYDLVKFKNINRHTLTKDNSLIDIYIVVFLNWLDVLIKKGIGKHYQTEEDKLTTIKGKIRISENLVKSNKIFCEFDELTISTQENKILKATLWLIIKMKIVSPDIQQRALNYYRLLFDIENIQLSNSVFSSIIFNKLNYHYEPLIELGKLIYDSCKLTDNSGNNIFSGFIANMNLIFEKFILKSLQQNLKSETVKPTTKNDWAIPNDELLPQIRPDILIKNRAIIDVKYYKTPFTTNGRFITDHIFQIVFYLQAYKLQSGFLVYPQPDELNEIVDKKYIMDNNNFHIFCIPLNREISDIENSISKLNNLIIN